MQVDPRSHVPIYLQIADAIRAAVAAAVYRAGEVLPSLRTMAVELGVNPNTVQRAYDELEREGLIHSQRGKGLFVSERAMESARHRAVDRVSELFREGVRSALAAGVSPEHLRRIFEAAFDGPFGGGRATQSATAGVEPVGDAPPAPSDIVDQSGRQQS